MKLTDEEVAKRLRDAKQRTYARTVVPDNDKALRIEVKAGMSIITDEGVFEFETDGDWILLPTELWQRTLTRLRLAEPRVTGKGDGGPRRN